MMSERERWQLFAPVWNIVNYNYSSRRTERDIFTVDFFVSCKSVRSYVISAVAWVISKPIKYQKKES